MPNYKKSLLGSSTMPFGTGREPNFTLGHHHHHQHADDGSCCGHEHHAIEAAETETASCGHDHAPGESCGK